MTVLTDAIVLKKMPQGDYDRQYVLLTRDLGKVVAIVKSGNKINSKLAPHLEFFAVSQIMAAYGRSCFRVGGAKVKQAHPQIKSELSKIALGVAFLEAVDLLLVFEVSERLVFAITESFLSHLDSSDSLKESILVFNRHLFEMLSQLGYQPSLKVASQRQLISEMIKVIETATEKHFRSSVFLHQNLIA
jgi:DNA repair protein RecO (recombination protein O)